MRTRYCSTCRRKLNRNAFPPHSSICFQCREERTKQGDLPSKPPTMLVTLRGKLDEIANNSDWEHRFVNDLLERYEAGRITYLTDKQYAKVEQIYRKYTNGQ